MGIKSIKVHISEDGTSVNGRVQYDIKTNQLVGFVPKLINGLPVSNGFPATSATQMQSHFKENTVSKNAYIIMAQPLDMKSPAFCVAFYGTDNRFQHTDVLQRWHWMEKAFQDAGLEVDGYSADGDGKLLKTMYMRTFSLARPCKWPWFHSSLSENEPVMIQDTIHLLVKLKSKLLKPSEIIPFGKTHVVSKGHLVALLNEVSKDQHQLTNSKLDAKDKMNFRAAQKLCDLKVTELLREKIPGSEGTVLYLDMMREVTTVFLDHELQPLDRVFLIWKWIFFLRLWKKWILANGGNSVGHNFITSNAYICIELNGLHEWKLMV
ncbi:8-amino-7-oxononanoate synthase [Frankliniella fusca]|uniref:8-amino-7-oxononanoate synthase n=1 Tax=Frankliniella fusca TaxID=407009 RepID=A0AAE1LU38_9NEOP|nr:8-amino-7-oxononanoate synthase [Frankliniella fusca]